MIEHTDTGYCFCDSCRPSRSYMTSFPQAGWTFASSPRLSDEDVERIAEAVVKKLKEAKNG